MNTYLFKWTGKKTTANWQALIFFFQFIGDLSSNLLGNWPNIIWKRTFISTLKAGTAIVLPLILVSMLLGISLTFSIHYILAPFNLQNKALFIAQNSLIRDFAPLIIGFVLCVQCGLNLIDAKHPSLHQPLQKVLLETIIPLIFSINFTALLLYAYISVSFYISVFFTFYYFLHSNTHEYLLKLSGIINPIELLSSLSKTVIFATIGSITAGYYYYDVANRVIPTRKAVSRIITRGLFWLVIISVLLKIYFL